MTEAVGRATPVGSTSAAGTQPVAHAAPTGAPTCRLPPTDSYSAPHSFFSGSAPELGCLNENELNIVLA